MKRDPDVEMITALAEKGMTQAAAEQRAYDARVLAGLWALGPCRIVELLPALGERAVHTTLAAIRRLSGGDYVERVVAGQNITYRVTASVAVEADEERDEFGIPLPIEISEEESARLEAETAALFENAPPGVEV